MLYSEDQYGLRLYGGDTGGSSDGTTVEEDRYYTDLRRYLPRFMWEEFREMNALLMAQGYEVGRFWYYLENYYEQVYVNSSTWGLRRWEKILGLATNLRKPYDSRRAAIKARLQVCATCTPALLATLATTTTGVEAIVVEDTANYEFTITFIGAYGVPMNMQVLKDAVEIAKPAHLAVNYKYKYVTWNELRPYTWDELAPYTWDGLRAMEITQRVTWNGIKNAGFTVRSIKRYTSNSIKNVTEAMT